MNNIIKKIVLSIASMVPISSIAFAAQSENVDIKDSRSAKVEYKPRNAGNLKMIEVIDPWDKRLLTLEEAYYNFSVENEDLTDRELDEKFEQAIDMLIERGFIVTDEFIKVASKGSWIQG